MTYPGLFSILAAFRRVLYVTDAIARPPAPSRHDQAGRDRLERVWAKNPTSTVFARLADAYLAEDRFEEAVQICHRGLRYRPAYVTGHQVLGCCLLAAGQQDAARDAFEKVLRLDRDHPAALGFLARMADRREDFVGAESLRAQLGAVDPLKAGVMRGERGPRADVERTGPVQTSEPGLTGNGDEPKPFATLTLARLYADQGYSQEALDLATWLAESNPDADGVREFLTELQTARSD